MNITPYVPYHISNQEYVLELRMEICLIPHEYASTKIFLCLILLVLRDL